MTHNSIFVKNLAKGVKLNRELLFNNAIYNSNDFVHFLNDLAGLIYDSAGLICVELPITNIVVDRAKSTNYAVVIVEFNPGFVEGNGDSYYFALAFTKSGQARVFSFELENTQNPTYAFCEYNQKGERKVYNVVSTLNVNCFSSHLYDILK